MTTCRSYFPLGTILAKRLARTKGEVAGALEDLAVFAVDRPPVGAQFGHVGALHLGEHGGQVDARLQGHAVDNVDQMRPSILQVLLYSEYLPCTPLQKTKTT